MSKDNFYTVKLRAGRATHEINTRARDIYDAVRQANKYRLKSETVLRLEAWQESDDDFSKRHPRLARKV